MNYEKYFQNYNTNEQQLEELKRAQAIKDRAGDLLDQYKDQMDEVTYNGAKEEIKKAKIEPIDKENQG